MKMIRTAAGLFLAAATLLVACGGGNDRTKAQVRLVNASSGDQQLDLRVDDQLRQGAVGYGGSASYVEADPGKASTITRAGSATALLSFTPNTAARKYYTVLAYGPLGGLKQLVLDENSAEPDANRSLLRVVNAAADAAALDVYLTGAEDLLAASVPVLAGVLPDVLSTAHIANSGTWRLRVTAAGSKTDLRLDVPALALSSKQVATLVLSPAAGGVLAKGLLLTQQAGLAAQAPTQARVRVAAGLADAGFTSLRLGGAAVLSNVSSPGVTQYVLVPAGTQSVGLTVGGVVLGDGTKKLDEGGDYTLLMRGTAASPLPTWVVDDNTLPSDRTQAKLRLVNGVSGVDGALSLAVDFLPVAGSVTAALATPYDLVSAVSATAQLTVTAEGLGKPLFSVVDQTLSAGAVYTVFMLRGADNATGVLRKDR